MPDFSRTYSYADITRLREQLLVPSPYHPGILQLTGRDALDLLHRLSTNNLNSLHPGQGLFTIFTTDKGRVIDHVLVLREADRVLLLVSPENEHRLETWLTKYTIMEDVSYQVISSIVGCNVVAGRTAITATGSLLGAHLAPGTAVQISTPSGFVTAVCVEKFGFEWVYLLTSPASDVSGVRGILATSMPSASPEEWEMVRVLHGIPKQGNELDEAYNPYEVGLRDSISFIKGCYIGQEVIARLDTYHKIQRQLMGVSFLSSLDQPAPLLSEGKEVGQVTSISPIAVGGKFHALAVIRKEIQPGDHVVAHFPERTIEGLVVSLPVGLERVV